LSSIALQVEADEAPLSQDVVCQRSTGNARLLWSGCGFVVFMLMGLLAAHQRPLPTAAADRQEMAGPQNMMASGAFHDMGWRAVALSNQNTSASHFAADVKAKMARGYEARGIRQGVKLRDKMKTERDEPGISRHPGRGQRPPRQNPKIQAKAQQSAEANGPGISRHPGRGRTALDIERGRTSLASRQRHRQVSKETIQAAAKHNAHRTKKDGLAEAKRIADLAKKDRLAEAKFMAEVERDKWGISTS